MRILLRGVLTLVAMVTAGGVVHAIDLRNEDDQNYRVTVTSTAMTRDLDVKSLTLSLIVCVGQCTFEVPGIGSVRATNDATVTIRDGHLTMTRPAAESAKSARP